MALGDDRPPISPSPRNRGTGTTSSKPTLRLYFVIFWTVLATFNFGFGTSELNPLQNVLSCPVTSPASSAAKLPSCIPLTSSQFGYITAAFTVGGFIASLTVSYLRSQLSILKRSRNVLIMGAMWNVLGGLVQMMAASWPILGLGRFIMGLGSGIAVATVPSYLNDISPPHLKGSIGVTNQLSIVVGIFTAQALGVSSLGSLPSSSSLSMVKRQGDFFGLGQAPWRYVPLISSGFALLQILLTPFTLDAPSDISSPEERSLLQRKLWSSSSSSSPSSSQRPRQAREYDDDEEEALLGEPDADTSSEASRRSSASQSTALTAKDSGPILTISDLLSLLVRPSKASKQLKMSAQECKETRRGAFLIIFTQMAQQLSGVNAVLYFSTGILTDVFDKKSSNMLAASSSSSSTDGDSMAKRIGLGITLVNVFMTFPPIPLIRENLLGRKRLFQLSSSIMSLSALLLSVSLLTSKSILAAISIVIFVAGFSIGLGPIPFLILPELVPKRSISAASSLGLSLNWLSNITVASLFLPLKESLSQIDSSNGGSIFLLFVLINAVSFTGITRYYSYRQVASSASASS